MNQQTLSISPFQERALSVPEEFDLFLGGGRGGGKSYALALLALRHAEQYGDRARILYVRRSFAGVRDFELLTRELFGAVYGTAARLNSVEGIWRFPNGAHMELNQLDAHADLAKYQGRSITLLLVDEAGQYADPSLLDLLRANLRGPKDVAVRMVLAGNPGGPGHHWLARRYVFAAGSWKPFAEPKSKRTWVYAPSTLVDNASLDRDQYREQLESACADDPELLRAWLQGDWAVARGAFFASVIDESRNAIDPWTKLPRWDRFLAHDFGSSAPSATLLCVQSPGAEYEGRYFPRDSIIVVDELVAHRRDNLNMGLGWTASVTAENIRAFCRQWRVPPEGVADDAIFARTGSGAGSIAEELARGGVGFQPARKADRISGWNVMRRLLADAGKPDRPGLYVSRACSYWWATVPYLARDQKRAEDVDSSGPDHAADATRYACLRMRQVVLVRPLLA